MTNQSDKPEFLKIMAGLSENFSSELTPTRLELLWASFRPYTIDQIRAAAVEICRTRKYTKFPTIADFIEAIEGSDEDEAIVQAAIVWDAITRFGGDNVIFDDPVTAAVVKHSLGGWSRLGRIKETERVFFQKEFAEKYAAFKRSGIVYSGILIGSSSGIDDKPVMIATPGRSSFAEIGHNKQGSITDGK